MIWTLAPNPALDLTYRAGEITWGEANRINEFSTRPGGKGINAALVAAQMGYDVVAAGQLGGAIGRSLAESIDSLSANLPGKLHCEWVWGDHCTRVTTIVHAGGQTTVLNQAGSPPSPAVWDTIFRILNPKYAFSGGMKAQAKAVVKSLTKALTDSGASALHAATPGTPGTAETAAVPSPFNPPIIPAAPTAPPDIAEQPLSPLPPTASQSPLRGRAARSTLLAARRREEAAAVNPRIKNTNNLARIADSLDFQPQRSSYYGWPLQNGDVLSINGSFPDPVPEDLVPSLIAAAKAAGAKVIVDTSGSALVAAAEAGADLLKPNGHELLAATNSRSILAGAVSLLESGAKTVMVSEGADGIRLYRYTSGKKKKPQLEVQSARPPQRIDGNPTGAGDAAVAAALVALHENWAVTDMLRAAVAWSAATVLKNETGVIDTNAATVFLDKIKIEVQSGL